MFSRIAGKSSEVYCCSFSRLAAVLGSMQSTFWGNVLFWCSFRLNPKHAKTRRQLKALSSRFSAAGCPARRKGSGYQVSESLDAARRASAPADPDACFNEEWEDTFRRWYPAFRPSNLRSRLKKQPDGPTPRNRMLSRFGNPLHTRRLKSLTAQYARLNLANLQTYDRMSHARPLAVI